MALQGEINLELDNEVFEPTIFVARLRQYEETVPLEKIQEQLRNKLALLKQQLYELINQDYPEFMSLANGLQGIEEHTHSLRTPLLDIAKSTEALMLGARSSREKMEALVVKRSDLERRKRALERGLKFSETLKEAEVLVGMSNPDHTSDELAPFLSPVKGKQGSLSSENTKKGIKSGDRLQEGEEEESDIDASDGEEESDAANKQEEEESVRLERATHCCLRLLADLRSPEIAEIPKLHLLADRAKQLQHEVLTRLTNVFVSEVTPPDKFSYSRSKHSVQENKLVPCLRALAAMQRGQELERAYGDLVLRPFIHATFTKVRLDNGERGSCKGLSSLYENTINYVKAACGDTLRINEQIFINQTTMSIDLLCNGVWATLSSALLSKFGDDLFVSGLPKLFHANYSSTSKFLRQLEDCALIALDSQQHQRQEKEIKKEEKEPQAAVESKEETKVESFDLTSRRLQIRQRLESHPATLELWKKWNLPVYFQLRAEEAKKAVDVALSSANKEAYQYLLKQSQLPLQQQLQQGSSSSDSKLSYSLLLGKEATPNSNQLRPLSEEEFGNKLPSMQSVVGSTSIQDRELNLLVMKQFHDAIAFCWRSEDVFLRPLAHKFLKLSLQIFAKFQAWLATLCSEKIKVSSSSTDSSNSAKNKSASNQSSQSGKSTDLSVASTATSFQWKLSTEELVLISCDIRRFCYWVNTILAPTAEKLVLGDDFQTNGEISKENDSSQHIVQESFSEATQQLLTLNSTCWKEIANQIASLCCEKLEAVKTVASSFRMTNKPPPTTCSPFLPEFLTPLKDFDDVFGSKAFDTIKAATTTTAAFNITSKEDSKEQVEGGRIWREISVSKISRRYCDIVSEVLTTARSMDDALRKRKKNNKNENQGLSDGEKIGLQLYLDVEEFTRELSLMQLNEEMINDSIKDLKEQVAPYSKFKM